MRLHFPFLIWDDGGGGGGGYGWFDLGCIVLVEGMG